MGRGTYELPPLGEGWGGASLLQPITYQAQAAACGDVGHTLAAGHYAALRLRAALVSAAHDPPIAGLWTLGVGLSTRLVRLLPVRAPLIDIAGHVVEAQFVGTLGTHGVQLVPTIVFPPSHGVDVIAATV